MENISPTLNLILEVKSSLEAGLSVRSGVLKFLNSPQTSFHIDVTQWFHQIEHQQNNNNLLNKLPLYRRTLLIVLEKGLRGIPILHTLDQLEKEVILACETEMEDYVKSLPLKMMIPLLLFLFPAYLILLFGPFLEMILSEF